MISDRQKQQLNTDLPAKEVKTREGGGNTVLSYVTSFYVIDKLNDVFGPGGWSYDSTPTVIHEGTVTNKDGQPRFSVSYSARCVLKIGNPLTPDCVIADVGYGHGKDRDPGLAHESAGKEAATDALKRCAKSLGRAMGLALYEKEQTHVGADQGAVDAVAQAMREAKDSAALALAKVDANKIKNSCSKEQLSQLMAAAREADARLGTEKKT